MQFWFIISPLLVNSGVDLQLSHFAWHIILVEYIISNVFKMLDSIAYSLKLIIVVKSISLWFTINSIEQISL